jgi:hypothetical protein
VRTSEQLGWRSLTVIAQLDLEQDPAVVVLLWDYRGDPVPEHMVPPEYEDVTDVEPTPQPGYRHIGTIWAPGVPQRDAATRDSVADATEQDIAANRAFLETKPTTEEVAAQVMSLTRQVVYLQQQVLAQYGREQDWSEFESHPDQGLPPITPGEPQEPEVPIDDGQSHLYSVEPTSGPAAGGNSITLHGSKLAGVGGVNFQRGSETQWAWGFQVVDDQTVTATVPPMSAGAVDVVALVDGNEVALENGYTYT